jgi:hypothetical protein
MLSFQPYSTYVVDANREQLATYRGGLAASAWWECGTYTITDHGMLGEKTVFLGAMSGRVFFTFALLMPNYFQLTSAVYSLFYMPSQG